MTKQPKTTGEHIIDLQGHIKGVKREMYHLKNAQDHIHRDIEKIGTKVDRFLYILLAALISAVIAIKIPLWEPQFLTKRPWHDL